MPTHRDPDELEELLQYMAPGSTIDDIVSDSNSDDEVGNYRVMHGGRRCDAARIVLGSAPGTNTQRETTSLSKMQPSKHTTNNASVLRRIRVDEFYGDVAPGVGGGGSSSVNQRTINDLKDVAHSNRLASTQAPRDVDRSERATVENVMDPRTRLLLYKLVNSGQLREINGCVSTGKEANVYYAVAGDGSPAAVKVFKTSILVFRDRDKYVSGEFRFQRYCKSNPRKMVRTWAEKEARNLNRLQDGGVLAPAVILLRQHVIVMEFLGEDGWPAPRLKEVRFPSAAALDKCYLDLCCTMRKMYGRSKLIHGDLSEYNLLLYRGRVVVIDVSQSVEKDHPRAMDFLRRDIVNVNAFFRTRGHQQLFSLQDLFHFITAPPASRGWQRCEGSDNSSEILQHLLSLREEREREGNLTAVDEDQAKVDEQVFLNIAVPRSLGEIADHRAPNAEIAPYVAEMTAARAESLAEVKHENQKNMTEEKNEEDEESDDYDECEMDDSDGTDDDGQERAGKKGKSNEKNATTEYDDDGEGRQLPKTIAEMTKEERKIYHKSVKEANRERRANKKKSKNGKAKKKK
ncbi:RIO1 family [Trypanosoma brucei equiperdum]|uniref:Serine/threonine-protein kinase RIO1 n=1 Tax=Trypanosoma brucei equiperdum TaxID=630700 RepID=A0A3L6LCX9_9TRYP|nr:RIO1 family [Trypanosoma brucei equiperdum]RHW73421.1 RIO1 family [Trypanosoma brucei equiperdum]RHW73800.1 RIO1 family [Trypanosoma brucei equiperdum]RHW73944.1 RIO1 family [Trypanosoma brucei equiperdum]